MLETLEKAYAEAVEKAKEAWSNKNEESWLMWRKKAKAIDQAIWKTERIKN